MAVANKIFSNGSRVLQKRNSAQNVIFNDADIMMDININTAVANRPNTGDLIIDFNTPITWICGNFRIGANANLIKKVENTNIIQKSTKTNDDNNGPGNSAGSEVYYNNSIFIPYNSVNNITELTISQQSGSGIVAGIQAIIFYVFTTFTNLSKLSSTVAISPNFNFLEKTPNLKQLSINISSAPYSNGIFLKNSSIQVLILRGYNTLSTITFINSLSSTLKYLSVTQLANLDLDLAVIFSGNLQGVNLSNAAPVRSIDYNGGAIFPPVINPIDNFTQDYIFYKAKSSNNSDLSFTPDKVSRFLVDFANQVTVCNLPTAAKRIRLVDCPPNTSYTDNSQPLFKTYTSALNHITTTLGITVSFT